MATSKVERFTQRARRVLALAQEAAEQMQHSTIGSEHVLLGMVREEGSTAGRVLRDMGLTAQRVEEAVLQLTGSGKLAADGRPALTSDTKRLLELAVDEARRLGHHYIGTEHLLLGTIRLREGLALDVLKKLDANHDEIRKRVRAILNDFYQSKRAEQSPLPAEARFLDWIVDRVITLFRRGRGKTEEPAQPQSPRDQPGDTPQQ